MIKYVYIPKIDEVPQWKQCYYNYKILKRLIKTCKETSLIIQQIQRKIQQIQPHSIADSRIFKQIQNIDKIETLRADKAESRETVVSAIKQIYVLSYKDMQKLLNFVQFKIFQLQNKLRRLTVYSKIVDVADFDLCGLVENTYTEVYMLKSMIKYNQAQQSLVLKNIKLIDQSLYYESLRYTGRVSRIQKGLQAMQTKLQQIYVVKCQPLNPNALQQFYCFGDSQKIFQRGKRFLKLGYTMGILLVATAIVIFTALFNDITIQQNKTFSLDFPVWRGASCLVVFQWVLGFSLMFLQKKKINYRMILRFQGRTLPSSQMFLYDAHITTTIFLVLFLVYILQGANIISSRFRYLGHIMWGVLIIYFLVPLPFTNYKRKAYFFKLLIYVALSPFPFISNTFPIIWVSQQAVSFSQPLTDFVCTAYKIHDRNWNCSKFSEVNMGILSTIFIYRIVQNTQAAQKAAWRAVPPFYGILRAFFALVTVLTSYFYRRYQTTTLFVVFVISAIVSTTVAVYTDIKTDWGLFSDRLLRKNLIFSNSPQIYYLAILFDIILRFNWTLNISPAFVRTLKIIPNYLIMIITYLQLLRRGIWNVLRLENQHVSKCLKFSATMNDQHIEDSIKLRFAQKIDQKQIMRQNIEVISQQQQLLTQEIHSSKKMSQQIDQFIEQKSQKLKQIRKLLKNYS